MNHEAIDFRWARAAAFALACAASSTAAPAGLAIALPEIVARAAPAVVHVSVSDEQGRELGAGSGFIISSDGRVVTNHHVVEAADRVHVTFQDGRRVEALGVLAFDEADDLAVLKLRDGRYSKLSLAAEPAKQGDAVVVLGSPLGFSGSVSSGIVSAVRPGGAKLYDGRHPSWTLQMTAAISSGSSGSPILNEGGDVVGVAVGALGAPVGQPVNFGVSVDLVKRVVAASNRKMRPFHVLRGGRSLLENLAISGAILASVVFVVSLWGYLRARRLRRERDEGRGVIQSILKR